MRGLKLDREGYRTRRQEVASFTDAWIETCLHDSTSSKGIRSHLLQMRGLKRAAYAKTLAETKSHLLQMRGLKQIYQCIAKQEARRIFYRCVD